MTKYKKLSEEQKEHNRTINKIWKKKNRKKLTAYQAMWRAKQKTKQN